MTVKYKFLCKKDKKKKKRWKETEYLWGVRIVLTMLNDGQISVFT